ncbi:hypothetical protein K8I28_05815 [bacterium]|nr:hypothetical protein [bacterium]
MKTGIGKVGRMNISFKVRLIGALVFGVGMAISLESLGTLPTVSIILLYLGMHIQAHGFKSLRISYPSELDKINE